MILPSDEDYQQTKHLKRNCSSLASPFKELAGWINSTYHVHVLNIVYDTIIVGKSRPRLNVVLETQEDALKFRVGAHVLGDFRQTDQVRVRKCFETILTQQDCHDFNTDGLLVVFPAFENVARIEANQNVPLDEIDRLKRGLNNNDLWLIRRCFDTVTFFFYTDAQVRHYEASGLKALCAAEYARIVQPLDEFGFLQRRGVSVRFDSKEDFETRDSGSWFFYDR